MRRLAPSAAQRLGEQLAPLPVDSLQAREIFSTEPKGVPANSSIAAGREPSPSTRWIFMHSRSGAYFLTNSRISSSDVPGAMLPIHSFMVVMCALHCVSNLRRTQPACEHAAVAAPVSDLRPAKTAWVQRCLAIRAFEECLSGARTRTLDFGPIGCLALLAAVHVGGGAVHNDMAPSAAQGISTKVPFVSGAGSVTVAILYGSEPNQGDIVDCGRG